MKWFEDIFTKSKLMIISGILGILIFAVLIINNLITGFLGSLPHYALFAVLSVLLLIAYKRGDTSCQKALSAALPAVIMSCYWSMATGIYGKGSTSVELLELFMAILATIIFVNHLLQQLDHKGDKTIVRISQIVLVIGLIVQFAELIAQIFGGGQYYDLLHCFALLCVETMITCIESRIQKYKLRRSEGMANGTWTEEERLKCKKIFKF